jgi:RNA polymerase sigma-70 factor (ECF subfamily)
MSTPGDADALNAHHLVDHLFRNRAGQMVAWLTRIFGPAHLGIVEEVVQDALLKALQQWPYSGVPDNPGGWLFRVARHGALDVVRRDSSFQSRARQIADELQRTSDHGQPGDWAIEDDELRMVFMCCHPSLPMDSRVALSLKAACGFSVAEIARAFLTAEPTIAQRLVRAKRVLRDEAIGLELPHGSDLTTRLESVLEVIYLLFNEGYNAHSGDDMIRNDLCSEALRLGRLVAQAPHCAASGSPAAHALVALMAFQSARLPARIDPNGELVLLEDQDRTLWDRSLIALGFAHFERSAEGPAISVYHVQAAIAAVHGRAAGPEDTRWDEILSLYDDLVSLNPSPVILLNRAVAVSRVLGADAALEILEHLEREPALSNYYLLPSVKARLLASTGDRAGAAACYRAALDRPCSEPERRFLLRRLHMCES